MNALRSKATARIAAIIIVFTLAMPAAVLIDPLGPPPAHARGFFKNLGKAIDFVVSVPQRLTRPLGPIAPLADIWLAGQMPTKFVKIFTKAKQIKQAKDDIAAQKARLKEVKEVYSNQAKLLRARAALTGTQAGVLESELLSGRIRFKEYATKVTAAKALQARLNSAAAKLEKRGKSLGVADVIRLFGGRVARTLVNDGVMAVRQEARKELEGLLRAKKAIAFARGKGPGAYDVIAEILAKDAVRELDGADAFGGKFKDRLRQRFKERLAETKGKIKGDWRSEIEMVMEEMTKAAGDLIKELDLPDDAGAGQAGDDVPESSAPRLDGDPGDRGLLEEPNNSRPEYPSTRGSGSGDFILVMNVSEYYADKIKLLSYDTNIRMDESGGVSGSYTVVYDEPGLTESQTIQHTEKGTVIAVRALDEEKFTFASNVTVHVTRSRGGAVFAQEDKTIANGFSGRLVSEESASGTLQLTSSYNLQWRTK